MAYKKFDTWIAIFLHNGKLRRKAGFSTKKEALEQELAWKEANEIDIDENGCHVIRRVGKNGRVDSSKVRKIFLEHHNYLPQVVRHTCDNPRCINPAHLIGGTHADNVRDRVERNRSAIGSRNGRAKLTEGRVRKIRRNNVETISGLSREYKVSRRLIKLIKDNKCWKHVQI